MKLPKIKKPDLSALAEKSVNKKFTIKNKFLQKNIISFAVIAVLLIGTGTAYGTLNAKEADKGIDPIYGVNQDRFQVLVSGKGYKLDKAQERNYKLQKKQNEVNAAVAAASAENNNRVLRTPTSSRVYRPGTYNYKRRSYTPSSNPRVTTNFLEMKSMKTKWKAGDKFQFRLSAYAYPYGLKNAISSGNITVKVNAKTAKMYRKDGNYYFYEFTVVKGSNRVVITATDKKNKKSSRLSYIIIAEKSNGGKDPTDPTNPTDPTKPTDPDDPDKPENLGDATATANLSGFGIKSLSFSGVVVDEDTTASDVLKQISDITMDGDTVLFITGDMSDFTLKDYSESELKKIYKKECDVEGDIDDAEFEAWVEDVEKGVRKDGNLGTGYPFEKSKWTYDKSAKGQDLVDSGITLTFTLYDD